MSNCIYRVNFSLALVACLAVHGVAAEDKPLGQWTFTSQHVKDNVVGDAAGQSPAKIARAVPLVKVGETEAMQFDGGANSVSLANDAPASRLTKNFSAEAWAKVDRFERWSRFAGIMARQNDQRKGWVIGTHYHRFVFSLGTDKGMTDLHSGGSAHAGNWYHVVGTYDGETMRLYVNGLLVGESKERTGDALLPVDTPFSMVDYHDGAEFYPLKGALHEVCAYDRVLSAAEIRDRYFAKAKALEAAPPLVMSGCFGDNMLLQAKVKLPVWGEALPGDKVVVRCAGQEATATANEQGMWRTDLPQLEAGTGPHEMVIETPHGKIAYKNVAVGEVWFCAGQSNMAWGTRRTSAMSLANKPLPNIRLFTVEREGEAKPANFTGGWWEVCDPGTVAEFAAVGFVFGHRLHEELKTPVGLFNASWGGTPVESWISRDELKKLPEMKTVLEQEADDKWERAGLYNKMVHPLVPYAIRGAVWYQGEGNVGNANHYEQRFAMMIGDWRKRWGEGDFPFYYVQIAPFNYGGHWNIACAELWDAQRRSLAVPNTGMAVCTDATNIGDNHASNKHVIGERLALWALAKTYGREGITYSGPLYRTHKVEGDSIRVFFDHAEGLKSRDGKALDWFTIAGEDQNFVAAEATIETAEKSGLSEDTVVVRSAEVKSPVAVRFAWSGIAQPNFFNKADLPASPFRTDDWPSSLVKQEPK